MQNQSLSIERKILMISSMGNLTIGIVGIVLSILSGAQAIMLDGLFNLMYFGTGLFTLKIAQLVQKGDDKWFPYGYVFFEPLINGIKGLLVLGLSIMAAVGAVGALFSGGRSIAASMAVGYGLFAMTACWALAWFTHKGSKKANSPLVNTDVENWVVNAIISTAVLVTFACIFLIRQTKLKFLVPYVDPIVVLTVVAISLASPVKIAWRALMELLNRTPSQELVEQVTELLRMSLKDLSFRHLYVRVIRPGRTLMIAAHVVLPEDSTQTIRDLDTIRLNVYNKLQQAYPTSTLDVFFTTNPEYGAPFTSS